MTEPLGCGACNLCCTLLGVPDIGKPARMRCWNTTVHGGCSVHAEKSPTSYAACDHFRCLWLASQDRPTDAMPRQMRPDQCHVVLGPQDREDNELLYVQVDPQFPKAWKEGPIGEYIQQKLDLGLHFEIIIDERRIELGADGFAEASA